MITIDFLVSIKKDALPETAKALKKADLPRLVELLSEKEDKIRYPSFLLLQHRSQCSNDLYAFWDTFRLKLKSHNSYQRSIGLMMIAENARWDKENKLDNTIDEYLDILGDEKPITVRQCIQSLSKMIPYKPKYCEKIAGALLAFNFDDVKETMRKSILLDIINILLLIRKEYSTNEIEGFILKALSGEILDTKSKKQIEAALKL